MNHDHDSKTNASRLRTLAQPKQNSKAVDRLATRIHEWYRARIPEEEFMKLPAQKANQRISTADQTVQAPNLYDPSKDNSDFFNDTTTYTRPTEEKTW